MAKDRILWNQRPRDVADGGAVDEIVAYGVTFHIEQMSNSCYWFSLTWPDGKSWDGNIVGKGINLQLQEDNGAPWSEDAEHETLNP